MSFLPNIFQIQSLAKMQHKCFELICLSMLNVCIISSYPMLYLSRLITFFFRFGRCYKTHEYYPISWDYYSVIGAQTLSQLKRYGCSISLSYLAKPHISYASVTQQLRTPSHYLPNTL